MRNQARFLAKLWAQEEELVAAGLEPIPEWWRREITRFYLSGKRRWVVRKGRRVFASTCVAPRLAVAEMLWGEHPHIAGSPPLIYAFLSVRVKEASARVPQVAGILNILHVKHETAGTTIRIVGKPAVFEVITASFRSTVGGTVAFAWNDEVASWNDGDTSRNPAEQVVGTLAPAQATLPNAWMALVSSPLTSKDYHARCFDEGETEHQCVSFGTTWEITKGSVRELTEEMTRALEPNAREWTRAYAAQPVDGVEEDWFGGAVDLAFREDDRLFELRAKDDEARPGSSLLRYGMAPIFTIDPAFAKHYFGWAVTTCEPANDNGRRLTLVHDSGAWTPDGEPVRSLERLRDNVLIPYQTLAGLSGKPMYVHTDQAEFYSLRALAKTLGITLLLVPWTGGSGETSKLTRYRNVRTAMLGDEVRILSHSTHPQKRKKLIGQFRSVSGVTTPSGNERIILVEDEKAGHCDELSAVVQGISLALESVPRAAKPLVHPVQADDPRKLREDAIRKVNERRAREMKRSPGAVFRKAMGL